MGYSSPKKGHFAERIRQTPFDRERTHFVGYLNYDAYVNLLQVSAANIYLTYPFVLSWSFMACVRSRP